MSLRSESMPYIGGISRQLGDLLRRNGMQAQIAFENDKYVLYAQGHDSPMLRYDISEQQMRALAEGGTNFSNKKAYQTFNGIVGRDFHMPRSFVSARNVNSRVAMGLHGYRERVQDYGRSMGMQPRPHAFGPGFLGWSPAHQEGFHLRRIGGAVMMPYAEQSQMVMQHIDGRIRPGELQSGSYGYYYKGTGQSNAQTVDPMQELKVSFPPVETKPRPATPAIAYKDVITSPVYFTDEKWQEVLSSHGIVIDEKEKAMTIQSASTDHDIKVSLTDEQLKKLTDNSLKSTPLTARLDIINASLSKDFDGTLTMDMLNSKQRISIQLKPEVASQFQQLEQQRMAEQYPQIQQSEREHLSPTLDPDRGYVDGNALESMNERKGWYREGNHGREVDVGDIWVEAVPSSEAVREQQMQENAKDFALKSVAANINQLSGDNHFNADNVSMNTIAEAREKLTDAQKSTLDRIYTDAYEQKMQEQKASEARAMGKTPESDEKTTYRMSAVINGQVITHEISRKQYDRFMAVDDYQRQRMMSKVFHEVDMKTRPEMRSHFNLGAFLAAGITSLSEVAAIGADIHDEIRTDHPAPEVYTERHGHTSIFVKPGVDSPEAIAQRAFDRGMNEATFGGLHR